MNAADATAIRKGTRELLNRADAASTSFIEYVQEQTGCTPAEATRVLNLYRKEKLLKVDAYMGTWHIKHGAFLDLDTLRRAIEVTA
jgi:hypothetical protein